MIWNCSNEWCLANLHFKRIKIQTQQNDFLSSYNNRAYLSLSPFWACHRIQKSHKIENFSHTFSTVCSISTEIQLEGYKRQYFQKTDIGLESFISPSCTCSSFSGSKKDVQKIKMASKSGDFIFKNWPSQRKMDFRKNRFWIFSLNHCSLHIPSFWSVLNHSVSLKWMKIREWIKTNNWIGVILCFIWSNQYFLINTILNFIFFSYCVV